MAQEFPQFDLVEELEAAEAAAQAAVGAQPAAGAGAGAQPPVGVGAQAVGAAARNAMRWTNAMSSFMLRRMCQLISSGVRTDKGFKEVHLNQVAKALQEYSGNEITGTQVYNHLRKWRQRWVRVVKLRELSGALWNEDTYAITLEDEHYKGHVKVCLPVKLIEVICCIHNFFSQTDLSKIHFRHTLRMLTYLTSP